MALVCGDIISKEVEDGTMRMVLSRPVSRGRILLLKLAACAVYTFSLVLFIVISSLAVGMADRGYGGLIVIDPWQHVFGFYEGGAGLVRFAYAGGVLTLLMLTFAALGFMFSCFNIKPATATILTLSIYLFDSIVHGVPYFEDLQDYLLTHHMAMWIQVFQPDIPLAQNRLFDSLSRPRSISCSSRSEHGTSPGAISSHRARFEPQPLEVSAHASSAANGTVAYSR